MSKPLVNKYEQRARRAKEKSADRRRAHELRETIELNKRLFPKDQSPC